MFQIGPQIGDLNTALVFAYVLHVQAATDGASANVRCVLDRRTHRTGALVRTRYNIRYGGSGMDRPWLVDFSHGTLVPAYVWVSLHNAQDKIRKETKASS
jgi:hypothetical protein